jgi:putative transposase
LEVGLKKLQLSLNSPRFFLFKNHWLPAKITISRFAVGRILRKNKDKPPSGDGPSCLTFIGHMKGSLWSRVAVPVDLFRCESIGPASRALKSHWVMVVLDQYTRRIIGFSVHTGDCDGVAYCRMFNEIISGKSLPEYLSSDNDPLFLFHRWQCNLRVLHVEELKSVPGTPTSHPFIERVIGNTRREYLDHLPFFNSRDLQNKLDQFQTYYNDVRAYSSLDIKTPTAMAYGEALDKNVISIGHYRWKKHCNGLYHLPAAA